MYPVRQHSLEAAARLSLDTSLDLGVDASRAAASQIPYLSIQHQNAR